MPEENGRHVLPLSRQGETPAQRQIEQAGFAMKFEDERPQARTGETLRRGPQQPGRIRHAHEQEAVGIEAQFEQAGRGNLAGFQRGKILPDPEQARPGAAGAERERQREAGRRASVAHAAGEHFMQGAQGYAARQSGIGCFVAQRNARFRGAFHGFEQSDGGAQTGQFLCRQDHGLGICSCYVLICGTGAGESIEVLVEFYGMNPIWFF